MGRVTVDVDGLGDTRAPLRQWYALMPEEGVSTDVKGHVELITQWWHVIRVDLKGRGAAATRNA